MKVVFQSRAKLPRKSSSRSNNRFSLSSNFPLTTIRSLRISMPKYKHRAKRSILSIKALKSNETIMWMSSLKLTIKLSAMPISKLSHLSRWLNSSSSTWTVQTNIKYRLQRKVYRKSLCCKTLPQSWMPPRINNWQVKALVQRSRSSLSSWWVARSNNHLATTSSLSILNTIITLLIRYRVRGGRPVMTKNLSLEPKKLPISLFRRNIFSKIL